MTKKAATEDLVLIGHRGARIPQCPQDKSMEDMGLDNSMSAIKRAIAMKSLTAMEVDTHLTSDGEVIVMHDSTLDRTTNGSGEIADHTLTELAQLTVKDGNPIPTLRDVLDIVPDDMVLLVDAKNMETAEAVAAIIKEYANQGRPQENMVIVIMFEPIVKRLRQIAPEIPIEIGIINNTLRNPELFKKFAAETDNETAKKKQLELAKFYEKSGFFNLRKGHQIEDIKKIIDEVKPEYLSIYWYDLDKDGDQEYIKEVKKLIKYAHSKNVRMAAWTVDDLQQARDMKALGISHMTTNEPGRLISAGIQHLPSKQGSPPERNPSR